MCRPSPCIQILVQELVGEPAALAYCCHHGAHVVLEDTTNNKHMHPIKVDLVARIHYGHQSRVSKQSSFCKCPTKANLEIFQLSWLCTLQPGNDCLQDVSCSSFKPVGFSASVIDGPLGRIMVWNSSGVLRVVDI